MSGVLKWMLRGGLLLWGCLVLPVLAQEFLDPAQAFKPSVRAVDDKTLEVRYTIAKGYYLYREKFRFSVAEPAGVTLGAAQFPAGEQKQDDNFGKVEVYHRQVAVRLPVVRPANAGAGPLSLKIKVVAQGCAEAGLCYPPQAQVLGVELPALGTLAAVSTAEDNRADAGGDGSGLIASKLQTAGFWGNLLFFFVAGLGLALTPCVFPMLPIVSGIVVGQGRCASRARGFALSAVYVLGMALTYALAGVAAGFTGNLVSSALQNPWVLGSFALVFVVLSGSMFGFYELQLPSALQSKLSEEAGHLQGGRGFAVFVMGALSALIVGPCVAAPLAGALLYIGQTHDAVLGGSALFVMALGMGVPLLVVGASAGALLPRTGAWMESVKKTFGIVLLGTAIWLLSPVLPPLVTMLAWAALLIVPAMYLHALDPLPARSRHFLYFWKGVGVLMLVAGVAILVGAFSGSRDPLQPLAALRGGATEAENKALPFERVASLADLEARLQAAKGPVLLDFYADWCVSCKEMEHQTFVDPKVRAEMARFTRLQADVTANSEADQALLQRFKLFGPPGIIFFDAAGQEISGLRVVGFMEAAPFAALLQQARTQVENAPGKTQARAQVRN